MMFVELVVHPIPESKTVPRDMALGYLRAAIFCDVSLEMREPVLPGGFMRIPDPAREGFE